MFKIESFICFFQAMSNNNNYSQNNSNRVNNNNRNRQRINNNGRNLEAISNPNGSIETQPGFQINRNGNINFNGNEVDLNGLLDPAQLERMTMTSIPNEQDGYLQFPLKDNGMLSFKRMDDDSYELVYLYINYPGNDLYKEYILNENTDRFEFKQTIERDNMEADLEMLRNDHVINIFREIPNDVELTKIVYLGEARGNYAYNGISVNLCILYLEDNDYRYTVEVDHEKVTTYKEPIGRTISPNNNMPIYRPRNKNNNNSKNGKNSKGNLITAITIPGAFALVMGAFKAKNMLNKKKTNNQTKVGGYKVHTGIRGGKYIIRNNKRVYV